MSNGGKRDKGEGMADKSKGKFKEAAGSVTGEKSRKNEGKADRTKGDAKDKKGDLKDRL